MKISFVVPAYNEEHRIAACITSIQKEVARVGADAEIIIVNNASTDQTKEIALGFPGVKVVDEMQKGLVRARARGHAVAAGELVANIDADVLLPTGWLTTVLDAFQKDAKLVGLSGPFIYYDIAAYQRAMVKVFYILGALINFFVVHIFHVGAMLQGGNFVLRKEAFDRAGGYDTTIEFYGEDTDVARRLSKVGKVQWTFGLPVLTSGRRLKGEGIVMTSLRYTANYFWIIFTGKPFSYKYKDIRPE